MSCCKDMRSVWGVGIGAGGNGLTEGGVCGGLITSIISAAGALTQLRLQTILENMKPLQLALGSRHSGPIIVGSLATGVLLYCGHRWLRAANGNDSDSKQQDAKSWKIKLKAAGGGGGDADGEDVVMGLETGHFEKLSPKDNVDPPLGLLEFEEVE